MTNCPNCGAPLTAGDICPYCGTHFLDVTMSVDKPFYIKIRHNGVLVVDKVRLLSAEVHMDSCNDIQLYADNVPMLIVSRPQDVTYSLELMSLHERVEKMKEFKE